MSNRKEKLSATVEKLMKTHPNLKEAPSDCTNHVEEDVGMMIKQSSSYGANNKCAPDNNIFYEERSNHLSSKGD